MNPKCQRLCFNKDIDVKGISVQEQRDFGIGAARSWFQGFIPVILVWWIRGTWGRNSDTLSKIILYYICRRGLFYYICRRLLHLSLSFITFVVITYVAKIYYICRRYYICRQNLLHLSTLLHLSLLLHMSA